MKRIFSLSLLMAMFSIAAFADIRPPDTPKPTPASKEKKSIESNMTIRLDKNATEARLIIPKNQLKQLRAELEDLDGGNTAMNVTRTQTIVSGLFLSLAIVFGGVWFSRKRQTDSKINKTIAAGVVVLLVGSAATIAFANMGPPPQLRSISSKLFNRDTVKGWNSAYGKVKIEVSDTGGNVELIVPDTDKDTKNGEE